MTHEHELGGAELLKGMGGYRMERGKGEKIGTTVIV